MENHILQTLNRLETTCQNIEARTTATAVEVSALKEELLDRTIPKINVDINGHDTRLGTLEKFRWQSLALLSFIILIVELAGALILHEIDRLRP